MRQLRDQRMSPQQPDAVLHCAHCGWSVREGPEGGYVCGQCFHTVEPPPVSSPGPVYDWEGSS